MTDGEWNNIDGSSRRDTGTAGYGNVDGTARTLPDGTQYDVSAANTQTRIYRDSYGDGTQYNTFSDLAFYYWATDAQPTIANEVRPIIRIPGAVNVGTSGTPYTLNEYWNPRNNPSTWQSLTTYTIGFGTGVGSGSALTTSGAGNRPWWGGNSWAGGDYNNLLTGVVTWGYPGEPNNYPDAKSKELWHAALSARGRYVPASNTAELQAAFAEILNQILLDSSTPITGVSASTQTTRDDSLAFIAGYSATRWSGELKGYGFTSTGSISSTVMWNAATELDNMTPVNRKIFTQSHDTTVSTYDALDKGIPFLWSNLTVNQKVSLQTAAETTSTNAQQRIAYLRGDRTLEEIVGGPFRNRASRLGDIVNSAPWFVGKPNMGYVNDGYPTFRQSRTNRLPMVYIGANDGMLHGFSVSTTISGTTTTLSDGAEKLAYLPRGIIANLSSLTDPGYSHRYYVDGKPFSGDFKDGSWKTALVGTLAGGGKGFFVLDVTNPAGIATATLTDIDKLVITDKTDTFTPSPPVGLPAANWSDIGHMYGPPTQDSANSARVVQITKLNNDRWALLIGNGVNSTQETAVLLIQYLDGNRELVKLTADATIGAGNGLSNPQVIDLNGDGKADIAYAGDLKGNLWKFDLTSASPSSWQVALNGDPLFVAKSDSVSGTGTSGAQQPIVTAPTWTWNRVVDGTTIVNGINLVFTTGRDMTAADPANTASQTIYSVWDNTNHNVVFNYTNGTSSIQLNGGTRVADSLTGGRTSLYPITQTSIETATAGRFMTTTSNAGNLFNYAGTSAQRGWYFNLPIAGERGLANPRVLDKRLVVIPTVKPVVGSTTTATNESCEPAATMADNYLTILDANTGKPYQKSPLFDTNNDGIFNATDVVNVSRVATGKDPMLFIPAKAGQPYATDFKLVSSRPAGGTGVEREKNARTFDAPARVGWRQLQ